MEENNYLTITDEEGNSYELEYLDTMEVEGHIYLVFLPADVDEDDERYGILIMEALPGDGDGDDDQYLTPVPDEDAERIYDLYMERIFSEEEEEDAEENEPDVYEFEDVDPEIFRDPTLMVKWLRKHGSGD